MLNVMYVMRIHVLLHSKRNPLKKNFSSFDLNSKTMVDEFNFSFNCMIITAGHILITRDLEYYVEGKIFFHQQSY